MSAPATTTIATPLRYPGSKWSLAPWIVDQLPSHATYVEPFGGSLAVFFNKPPGRIEYVNDLDGSVVQLFRMIRERGQELADAIAWTPWARAEFEAAFESTGDPLARARRTLVRHWMAYGGIDAGPERARAGWKHGGKRAKATATTLTWRGVPARLLACMDRLKNAHIEQLPAEQLLARLDAPTTLFYVDPPYLGRTRSRAPLYRCEMGGEAEHLALLAQLRTLAGLVLLSGYPDPLYDEALPGWTRLTAQAGAQGGGVRTEALWLNPAAAAQLGRDRARRPAPAALFDAPMEAAHA